MRSVGRAVLVAGGLALGVTSAEAQVFQIQLPPLADMILNGNVADLDPELLEALGGDYSFALGISIGSAFASENLQVAEAITSGIVVQKGPGSAEVDSVVETFASPELAEVRAWVAAQARTPVTAN